MSFPLGLFEYSLMKFDIRRDNDTGGEPSIAEMTDKAIRILSKNPKGFFLFVEGKITMVSWWGAAVGNSIGGGGGRAYLPLILPLTSIFLYISITTSFLVDKF